MADIRVQGHAAVFGERSEDLGGFVEIIRPGAFAESLKRGNNVYLLHSHDVSRPLATTASGSLSLREDKRGLRFDARLADVGTGGEVGALIRRGDISKMSFGFFVRSAKDEEWRHVNNVLTRFINKADLVEISTVSFPAYPAASVSARSIVESMKEDIAKREAVQQAARQRERQRKRIKVAEADLRVKTAPAPSPERPEVRRARIQSKRSRLANTR